MCWRERGWMLVGLRAPFPGSFQILPLFEFTKVCKASSPAAYPHLSSGALDDLSYDMTIILNQCLSHPSLHPKNLGIIPRRKSWLLNLDVMVLSDSGNVYDALFLAARSALWDTKVPKTRSVQYQPKSNVAGDQDVEMSADGSGSIFNTREVTKAADFELADYWDEGGPLEISQEWPVCVTLNLVRTTISVGVGAHRITGVSETTTGILPRCNTARGSIGSTSVALTFFIFSIGNETAVDEVDGGWRGPTRIDDPVTRGELILPRGPYSPHPDSFLTCPPSQAGENHARKLFQALESKLREEDLRRNQKALAKFDLR